MCRCAENYRQLCTGESGIVPVDDKQREGAGKARHFKVPALKRSPCHCRDVMRLARRQAA